MALTFAQQTVLLNEMLRLAHMIYDGGDGEAEALGADLAEHVLTFFDAHRSAGMSLQTEALTEDSLPIPHTSKGLPPWP